MKVVITGAKGMLGADLCKVFSPHHDVVALSKKDLDITQQDQVFSLLNSLAPGIVINAAAYTKVDDCEINSEKAYQANADGPRNCAQWCHENKSQLIHFSTDYVFDGNKKDPYHEEDEPNPINVYGRSKLTGENNISFMMKDGCYKIVRSSWLFGLNGNNFVKTLLKLAESQEEINVVNDQWGCPTYTFDLAEAVLKLSENNESGIFHICNSGSVNWAEFAKYFFSKQKLKTRIHEISSKDWVTLAKRPEYSVLSSSNFENTFDYSMRPWTEAIQAFLRDL